MLIPNLPSINTELIQQVQTPQGTKFYPHPAWHSFFSQLITALQNNLSEEGYALPQQSNANVTILNPKKIGNVIYNSDQGVGMINNNGTFQQIYTRPQELTTTEISNIPTDQINGTWVYNTTTSKLLYGLQNAFHEVAFT